jgi:hypothetical protein
MADSSKKKGRPKKDENTPFKLGNKYWKKEELKEGEEGEHVLEKKEEKNFTRLPLDDYLVADVDPVIKPSILRATGDQLSLAEKYLEDTGHLGDHIIGNRLVNMSKLEDLINSAYAGHFKSSPGCPGKFGFPGSSEINKGICTIVQLECQLCKYRTTFYKLYEEVESDKPGQKAAKPNVQLVHFLSKCPISYSDVQLLFACVESVCLSVSGIHKLINRYSHIWTETNTAQIEENRRKVKDFKTRREDVSATVTDQVDVSVEIDTSYASPPKGRAMNQPSSQSVTPLLENDTNKKMLLGLTSFSRLCSHGTRCNGQHDGCTRNWDPMRPLGNSESVAGEQLYLENIKDGINISEVTHDGVRPNTHALGMKKAAESVKLKGPESLLCTIHLARGQKRKAYSLNSNLSKELTGGEQNGRKYFIQRLIMAIDKRCSYELRAASKKFGRNVGKFRDFMESARLNILDCFSGNHKMCRRASGACRLKTARNRIPTFLPNSQYLQLSDEDRNELQTVIDYRLSSERAHAQRKLRHTNKVESFHLRLLKVTPKSKTCKRHYANRNHSAAHNASVGVGNSIIEFNEKTNSHMSKGSRSIKSLVKLTEKASYYARRQGPAGFKERRKALRKRKLKFERLSKMMVTDGPTVSDHSSYCST